MTNRERFVNSLTYKSVDKLPLLPGVPRRSTLKRWRQEGLPEDIHYLDYVFDKLNIDYGDNDTRTSISLDYTMNPKFEEKVLSHENGHYVVQTWSGEVVEISDEFSLYDLGHVLDFITRAWLSSPVKGQEDWEDMKRRYNAGDLTRLPSEEKLKVARDSGRSTSLIVNGPFWQMRDWMGFEDLCIAFIEQPDLIADMADFWGDFISELVDKTASLIDIDYFRLSEDMAYKAHSMISPSMMREFLLPVYKKCEKVVKKHNIPIYAIDSDGYISDIIPVWKEGGVNCTEPIEVAAHNDINVYREMYGNKLSYFGGIDKRCLAAGGSVMEKEVRRVVEPFLKTGGLVPSCDHGVPHDISLQNYIDYTKLLAQLGGWL